MATKPKKDADVVELNVIEIAQAAATFKILGRTPMIFNRMAAKAKRELLMPRGRLSAADKAANQKHDPMAEFVDSAYRYIDDDHPTRLYVPAPSFKGAMMSAALDMPGVFRTQIGRLLWIDGYSVDIYGVPQLRMDTVRMADAKKTPDIRTRACLPEWACQITVHYSVPLIRDAQVASLLVAGGFLAGVGDFRQERGKGNYGQYMPIDENQPEALETWERIVAGQGRKAQDAAFADPEFFDPETEELFGWFVAEKKRRTTPKLVKAAKEAA